MIEKTKELGSSLFKSAISCWTSIYITKHTGFIYILCLISKLVIGNMTDIKGGVVLHITIPMEKGSRISLGRNISEIVSIFHIYLNDP